MAGSVERQTDNIQALGVYQHLVWCYYGQAGRQYVVSLSAQCFMKYTTKSIEINMITMYSMVLH